MVHAPVNGAISEYLHFLNVGAAADLDMLRAAFWSVLTDPRVKARDTQLGALLSGVMVKGPTPSEVAMLIRTALQVDGFQRVRVLLPPGELLVGVAGSGKKGVKTMNISTPACVVAAAGGAFIAKPGSGSTSSASGSSDFAKVVGINVGGVGESIALLHKTGLGLFSIENLIPGFDQVYGQRMFGLNPLSFAFPAMLCPVEADRILYGLSHPNVELSLEVFDLLGVDDVMVVTSTDDRIRFIDELGMFRTNLVGGRRSGVTGRVLPFNPLEEVGILGYRIHDVAAAGTMIENVQLSVLALAGQSPGAREDVIAVNAGTILYLAGKVENRVAGFHAARDLIRSGRALAKLEQCAEVSGGSPRTVRLLLKA